jgi:hypothetical protein
LADPDDVGTQVLLRATRSRLVAAADPAAARRLADEAVAMAQGTASLAFHADALRNRAELLASIGDVGQAGASLDEAVRLYERKGDIVSAAEARAALSGAESGTGERLAAGR